MLAKEHLHTDHQRAEGIAGGHHQRPQEVADVCQELEDGDGGENRARKRDDQSPVHAEATGAIHQRGLFQFFRNADEKLVEQEDGEGVRDERDDLHLVAIDPGGRAVEPGEIVGNLATGCLTHMCSISCNKTLA